jgi:hypothetical protein
MKWNLPWTSTLVTAITAASAPWVRAAAASAVFVPWDRAAVPSIILPHLVTVDGAWYFELRAGEIYVFISQEWEGHKMTIPWRKTLQMHYEILNHQASLSTKLRD